jgi:hypothetical protein
MAENVRSGGGKLPGVQVLKTILSRAASIEADLAESRGELGSFVKDAEEKHNIHRKAFKLSRQLVKMDETKLAEFLRHFDHYRKCLKIDELAGADMFDEREPDPQPANDTAPGAADAAAAAANSEALKEGIKPSRSKPKGTDDAAQPAVH